MDEIRTVITRESAELVIEVMPDHWRAVIRNEQFGEIVDAHCNITEDEPLRVLLYNLNVNCTEWLTEVGTF